MKIKLYCLPYSGATASTYASWNNYESGLVEICPIELAGRGSRFREAFYPNFEAAVNDLFGTITKDASNENYALFGHSLGGILAYEVARKIKSEALPEPIHLFISGHSVPDVKQPIQLHKLEGQALIDYLEDLGGLTDDFREDPKLMDLFIPVIRADFKLVDEYRYDASLGKIFNDITVFHGSDDFFTADNIERWEGFTHGNFTHYPFKGGHFFVNECTEKIINIITQTLEFKNIYI